MRRSARWVKSRPRRMAVKFATIGGDTPQTQFSDNFTRADSSTLGSNWGRLLANNPTAIGTSACFIDSISTNNMFLQGSGQLNPVVFYETGFMPMPVYFNLYNKDRTVASITTVSLAIGGGGVIGLCCRFNTDLRTGVGARDYDAYFLDLTTGSMGAVTRFTSTGSALIIAGQGWTHPGTFGIRCSGVGGTVLVETFLNGVAAASIADTNASRILNGSPIVLGNLIAGQSNNFQFRASAFSCGVF